MNKSIVLLAFLEICLAGHSFAQDRKELKWALNEKGSHYLKATLLNQVWVRYTQNNPGTLVRGFEQDNSFDISLRRLRFQLYGQITNRIFFYSQFGQNNFNYQSPRFTGAFFHDALVEYKIKERSLSFGTGLTGWNGYLRYASPAAGNILGLDVPLYQQATNSTTDQFLRKLSIYAKGKISKLDYRLALSSPMVAQNSTSPIAAINPNSDYSGKPPKTQQQAYLMWQFLDEESNLTPYTAGSYLGTKKIFNIGAGIIHQADAMWHSANNGDTLTSDMSLIGLDLYYDAPLNAEKGTALTAYAAYSYSQFGPNYLRNVGVNNVANAINQQGSLSGAGNAYPMLGTGTSLYAQVAYKMKNKLLSDNGTLQVYATATLSNYQALDETMRVFETGVNYLIHGSHGQKISLGYQNRPVFTLQNEKQLASARRGMFVMQWQVAF